MTTGLMYTNKLVDVTCGSFRVKCLLQYVLVNVTPQCIHNTNTDNNNNNNIFILY